MTGLPATVGHDRGAVEAFLHRFLDAKQRSDGTGDVAGRYAQYVGRGKMMRAMLVVLAYRMGGRRHLTDDVLRSLTISQRLLGTREIILIHHTDCGMVTFTDDAVKAQIEADTGLRPSFALEAFPDEEEDVRQSMRRIQACPFVPVKDRIRGFVYDVTTGQLNEVN